LLNAKPNAHLGIYLHCGQLQLVNGLRAEPSQQRSAVHILIGSHLHVALLNVVPDKHYYTLLHVGQLQLLNGSRAEPSQQRSLVQVLTGSQVHVS
jgi:hypothetical protein